MGLLRSIAARVTTEAVKGFLRDFAFLAGVGTIACGIWMLSHPAAFIFIGVAVSLLAYLSTPNEPRQ